MSAQSQPIARLSPGGRGRARGRNAVATLRGSIGWVVLRRLLLTIPLLFVVTALSFVLVSLTPGNPAREILGVNGSKLEYARLERSLGLNEPIYTRYWRWLEHVSHGNLGVSTFNGQAVTGEISRRAPTTLSLMLCALLVVLVVGVGVGVFSAVRGGVWGRVFDGGALLGFAMPSFWLGVILISLFAVKLRVFPATGYVPFSQSLGAWLRALVLPVLALALNGIAVIARQTRDAMLEALGSEYVRMARANGIPERSIVFRLCLKQAGVRIVTVLGLQAVGLLAGTVLVETVFALPGVGGLLVSAAEDHDIPVVQGIVVYFTLIVVVVNLVTDLAYSFLNPTVRLR